MMKIEERLTNLERDVRLITEKLIGIASFENMIIENLDKFEEMNRRIQREYYRILDLVNEQANNHRIDKIEMQRLVEDSPICLGIRIIKKIKSIFKLND